MDPGDRLLLYTDGVTEAMDAGNRDEFGSERLAEVFLREATGGTGPQPLLVAVQSAVGAFTAGARQHDDITLVVIERE
jgi:sigma-B regulation protein RsbU (phosphoserine phosphatase)